MDNGPLSRRCIKIKNLIDIIQGDICALNSPLFYKL